MKKQTKKKLIYVRYILPPVLIALMLAAMLIPSYRYVTDGEVNDAISAFSLIANSYDQSRAVLFGTEEQTAANLLFSRILLAVIIISAVLFVLAFAVSLYCAVMAVRYFTSDDEERTERSRTLFITLLPNRIAVSVLEALVLPLALFPYLMTPLYKTIYGMSVTLILTAPDALILGGVALLAIFTLSIICAPAEREFQADIFKKTKLKVGAEKSEDEGGYIPVFNSESTASESEKKEHNERIRELLGKNKDN